MGSSLFYRPEYWVVQQYPRLEWIEKWGYRVAFSIEGETAISLPKALFGSVEKDVQTDVPFPVFWKEACHILKTLGAQNIRIFHPPNIYPGFVSYQELQEVGLNVVQEEIHHFIPLNDFHIHPMEKRKLDKLEKAEFIFRKGKTEELKEAFHFLSREREKKNIPTNVTFPLVENLFETFPESYQLYIAEQDGTWAAVLILARISENVIYYFLPATSTDFRSKSPMVGLMLYATQEHRKDHQYFDLGISSVKGTPQSGLIQFKERMGGIRGKKLIFERKIP
jgi:hypothetical protein